MIPPFIENTLDWLIRFDHLEAGKLLSKSVHRHLPPDLPETSDFLAHQLFKCKAYNEAVKWALNTLKILPDSLAANVNAAKCLIQIGDVDRAEKILRAHLDKENKPYGVALDLNLALTHQGRFEESLDLLQYLGGKIPPHEKDYYAVQFNMGWHLIRQGDFKKGFHLLTQGRNIEIWGNRHSLPEENLLKPGQSLKGQTILLKGEGGIGDEIINARFAQTIKERGGKPVWAGMPALMTLFQRIPGMSQVLNMKETGTIHYHAWAPAMDLPRLIGLDLNEIPSKPYIFPDPQYINKWQKKLKQVEALKIGLRWRGNPRYETDLMRSVPFLLLEQLQNIPGLSLYSLQRDDGADERPLNSPVADWGSGLETWEDTAGAIANMDLIITSCTSVAHLAAAMGKPTWIFCPLVCYYIWCSPGESSPWYSHVRLFRQTTRGSWQEPFDQISRRLREMTRERVS